MFLPQFEPADVIALTCSEINSLSAPMLITRLGNRSGAITDRSGDGNRPPFFPPDKSRVNRSPQRRKVAAPQVFALSFRGISRTMRAGEYSFLGVIVPHLSRLRNLFPRKCNFTWKPGFCSPTQAKGDSSTFAKLHLPGHTAIFINRGKNARAFAGSKSRRDSSIIDIYC